MVSNPRQWIKDFQQAGASGYTLHIEAVEENEIEDVLKEIREAGMNVGVAIKPKTNLTQLHALLEKNLIDMVLIMTVEPGFGGQSFMADMMPKVEVKILLFPTVIPHTNPHPHTGATQELSIPRNPSRRRNQRQNH